MSGLIPHYFPTFLWKFWLSDICHTSRVLRDPRVHVYDVYDNELTDVRDIPACSRSAFEDFRDESFVPMSVECLKVLEDVEAAFHKLESLAEEALTTLFRGIPTPSTSPNSPRTTRVALTRQQLDNIRTYLVFLRFRNSSKFAEIVDSLQQPTSYSHDTQDSNAKSVFSRPFFLQVRRRVIFEGILAFLKHSPGVSRRNSVRRRPPMTHDQRDVFHRAMEEYCWKFCGADVFVGVASEKQEYMMSDTCYGTLQEGYVDDPQLTSDLFFSVLPTVAVYILANADASSSCSEHLVTQPSAKVFVDCSIETPVDIYLRNAMLLQTYPQRLYFTTFLSVTQSITCYDSFRWIPEHQDYTRLKQRCRHKHIIEGVTKTLLVKGRVIITDLTDEVVKSGNEPLHHGSFSDVWKGEWKDSATMKRRVVAVKFLRQVMAQNLREKLLKRLQDEVVVWHRLDHPNILPLFGIVQSPNSVGMVSPWCENGTMSHYVRRHPSTNKLDLLSKVASGVAYLHSFKPVVVHGDLKGGNILIGDAGEPLITDFGLSTVVEDLSDSLDFGSSCSRGTTRWMAPELIFALAEDNGKPPIVTTQCDVYSFASVCLEVLTGRLPFCHRTNDYAVTLDILRGVPPTAGLVISGDEFAQPVWAVLTRCWDREAVRRPDMTYVAARFLELTKQDGQS
ncbi:hypothetical protein ONZ45_g12335 [Pleurotus djamor]|nr:hypothetical protein ONZ45_g12335 [Pleurotus djamor]